MKLEAKDLNLPGIRHGFFTRQGGVSEGIYNSLNIGLGSDDDRAKVLENRKRVAETLGAPTRNLVSPYQIHSADVIAIDAPFDNDADRKADALVTSTKGMALGVATADCGPILFADPKAKVIGAAHSGWKGAVTGILENTIVAMEGLGAKRTDIVAVLGPTISQAAYEVGPEFYDRFLAQNKQNRAYFINSNREGHHQFDLPAFITEKLKDFGVLDVSSLQICTYQDEERFYSYRRTTHRQETDYGRQISAIMLV